MDQFAVPPLPRANNFAHRMAIEYTHPECLKSIEAGTRISLSSVHGSSFTTWTTSEAHDISTISLAMNRTLCRTFKLTSKCFKLIWNRQKNGNGTPTEYEVTYVITPMRDVGWRDSCSESSSSAGENCFVCHRVCRDADDDDSRDANCQRCQPCFLCDDCKIYVGGAMCCFFCLKKSEVHLARNEAKLMLRALCPWLFEQGPGDEGGDDCVCP